MGSGSDEQQVPGERVIPVSFAVAGSGSSEVPSVITSCQRTDPILETDTGIRWRPVWQEGALREFLSQNGGRWPSLSIVGVGFDNNNDGNFSRSLPSELGTGMSAVCDGRDLLINLAAGTRGAPSAEVDRRYELTWIDVAGGSGTGQWDPTLKILPRGTGAPPVSHINEQEQLVIDIELELDAENKPTIANLTSESDMATGPVNSIRWRPVWREETLRQYVVAEHSSIVSQIDPANWPGVSITGVNDSQGQPLDPSLLTSRRTHADGSFTVSVEPSARPVGGIVGMPYTLHYVGGAIPTGRDWDPTLKILPRGWAAPPSTGG